MQEKHNCKKSGKGAVLYLCRYRAMYRAMALYLLEKGISGDEKISEACHDADISIRYENGEQQVILNGKKCNCVPP